ncbi:hypothetical protein [Hymenobacter metallilatus]|uniref:Uncharacterized protein n=1 Tax=Hymenobacter metallilatus TaxID=2493666 RepID=A0A3R9M0S1_9BACT|nr:hypothetical protein [Hymenobacter metallilatus]RSK33056.1 hypothetical protein EI290_10080 [Hymenobacter metallilatus]
MTFWCSSCHGPLLSSRGFAPCPVLLTAATDTLMKAASEAILAIRNGEDEDAWQTIVDGFPQNTMLKRNCFEYLHENVLLGHYRIKMADTHPVQPISAI